MLLRLVHYLVSHNNDESFDIDMTKRFSSNLPAKIYAEAIVRSQSCARLLSQSHLVTSNNVSQFYAEPTSLIVAARRLQDAGFEVLAIGKTSISIVAAPEVYERSLQTTLETVECNVIKELGLRSTATFINSVDEKPFGEIDISTTRWDEFLDGIAINSPTYYFSHSVPSPLPPPISKKYLSVPDGIAQELNATLVHRSGIKGKGVKVAMVDTGWYPHPFFRQNNYKVNVIPVFGSDDPFQDDRGHGTGESANIFALAPEVELTMVKADVIIDGEPKGINSIAAFKKAVALQPDIISCSWGLDLRNSQLLASHQALAAVIADAVKQGIIVIFSAGNGHWGFPAQHPDVIAAGGAYKHLDGALKGRLEASNYASGFVSPIYAGRRVPDVCGLVGQLPYGTYIMLPVPPNSLIDRDLANVKDGTHSTDGWAAFSGTSAAAPQLAGICALIKQVAPNLSPEQVRQVLQQTAYDVVDGRSNPASGGLSARVGVDLATGYGLADAEAAVRAAKALDTGQCCDRCTSQNPSFSNTNSNPKRRKSMSNQFPKLKLKLDEIQARFDEVIRTEFIDNGLIEDVELKITTVNFEHRSPQTRAASALRDTLSKLHKIQGQLDAQQIQRKHISAAESLLKINRSQELATQVLIAAIQSTKPQVSELAAKALGEITLKYDEQNNIPFFPPKVSTDCQECRDNGKKDCPCIID